MKPQPPQLMKTNLSPRRLPQELCLPDIASIGVQTRNPARITAEEVMIAVRRLWDILSSKSVGELADAYSTNSISFRVGSMTVEPGFLGVAQRSREYFHEACTMDMELGPIEVILLNDAIALAVYTFHFKARNRATAKGGSEEEEIPHGRATQVFHRDADGKLRIVHEHFSSAVG